MTEYDLRQSMGGHLPPDERHLGLNQGTAGNLSVRHGDGFLITPSSMPYDLMEAAADWLASVCVTTTASCVCNSWESS